MFCDGLGFELSLEEKVVGGVVEFRFSEIFGISGRGTVRTFSMVIKLEWKKKEKPKVTFTAQRGKGTFCQRLLNF